MIDIAMLACNRARITEISIREIAARTETPYRLTVLDNGSTDGSQEMLNELAMQNVIDHLILLQENTGVHWGHNMLLHTITQGYVRCKRNIEASSLYVCTDNDLVPSVPVDGADWLSRLVDLMERHPEYGAIACRPHVLIGEPPDRFDGAGEVREMHHVGAHLRLMRTALVREVGGWERHKRPSRNHEERHICGLIRKAGYKVGYSRDVRCLHLFGDPDLGEDPWGYTAGTTHEGHREIWPPANVFSWDKRGIDWETCE